MRRLAPMLGGDRRRIELAYSLQLSMPGTPVIRYGEEIGMGDNLDLPERDAIRTPMQWDSAAGAGFSRAEPGKDAGSLRSTRAAARRRVRLLASRPRPAGLVPPARPRFPLDSHGPPAGRLARPGQHGGGQRGGQCHRQGPDGSAPPLRRRSVRSRLRRVPRGSSFPFGHAANAAASTRLAGRLAADLPEATIMETDAGDPPNPGSSTASTRTRWWSTARPTTSQTGDVAPRRAAKSGQRSEGR